MGILFTTLFSMLGLMICMINISNPKPVYIKNYEEIKNKKSKALIRAQREFEEKKREKELDLNAGILGSLPERAIAEQYEASASDIYSSVSRMFGF